MINRRVVACLFILMTAPPCLALPPSDVADQSNSILTTNTSLQIDATFSAAQTFTVGVGGTLSRVQLGVFRRQAVAQALTIDIVQTQAGVPLFTPGGILATRTVASGDVPLRAALPDSSSPFFSLDVDVSSANIPVHTGDVLAVLLRSESAEFNGYAWWASPANTPNPYPNGSAYSLRRIDNFLIGHSNLDAQFANFVIVPEPASAMLFGMAVVFGVRARRRTGRLMPLKGLIVGD